MSTISTSALNTLDTCLKLLKLLHVSRYGRERERISKLVQVILQVTDTVVWLVFFEGTYDFKEATTFKGHSLMIGGLLLRDRDRARVPLMFLFELVHSSKFQCSIDTS